MSKQYIVTIRTPYIVEVVGVYTDRNDACNRAHSNFFQKVIPGYEHDDEPIDCPLNREQQAIYYSLSPWRDFVLDKTQTHCKFSHQFLPYTWEILEFEPAVKQDPKF